MSSGWCEGGENIPKELHHRPKHLIIHMRNIAAKSAEVSGNITQLDEKHFCVESGRTYNVYLGDDTAMTMPSCSCVQFQRTHLPCKHVAAVFGKFEEINFQTLPSFYSNNPMFTVDLSSLNMKETDLNIPTTTFSEKVDIIEKEEADSHDQVEPVTTLHLNKSATRVRESLSKLRSLAYIVNSVELLDQAKADLDGIMKKLLAGCPSEVGLTLEPTPSTKQTKVPRKRKIMISLNKLPSRKKRKQTKPSLNTIKPLSSPNLEHTAFNKTPRRVPSAKETTRPTVLHETNQQHIQKENCDVNSTLSEPGNNIYMYIYLAVGKFKKS
jgi:hypothetical protein